MPEELYSLRFSLLRAAVNEPNALVNPRASMSQYSIFDSSLNSGVFLSTNQGESWTAVNAGLTDLRVRTLAVAEGTLFAGTLGSGVFVTDVTR